MRKMTFVYLTELKMMLA